MAQKDSTCWCSDPFKAQAGFTLVELVVTMVIIGIMAIAVVPRMDLLRGFDEIGFRDQVKATLEYARKSAVAGRRWTCVIFEDSNGNGRFELAIRRDERDPDLLTAATANCTHATDSGPITLPGLSINRIEEPASVTTAGPSADIMFDPLGRVWGPASDCNPASTTQYCYSVQETGSAAAPQIIRVERETGYVR